MSLFSLVEACLFEDQHFSRWPQLIAEADKLFEQALPLVKMRVEGKTQAGADEVQNVIAELLEANAKEALPSSITLCWRDDAEQTYYFSVPEVKAKAFYEKVIEKKKELDKPLLVLIFLAVLYMPQKPKEYAEALTFNIKLMCYQLQKKIPAKQQQDGFFKPSADSKLEAILLITNDFMRQDKHDKVLGYQAFCNAFKALSRRIEPNLKAIDREAVKDFKHLSKLILRDLSQTCTQSGEKSRRVTL